MKFAEYIEQKNKNIYLEEYNIKKIIKSVFLLILY
jgi:hypothetical protein